MVRSKSDQTDKDSEIKSGVYFRVKASGKDTGRGTLKMLLTGPLDDSAVSYAKAFMATPKKKKNPKFIPIH